MRQHPPPDGCYAWSGLRVHYLLSVVIGLVLGALLGALLGFVPRLVTGQDGWSLVIGSLGACGGALWASILRASGKTIWRVRPGARSVAAPSEHS